MPQTSKKAAPRPTKAPTPDLDTTPTTGVLCGQELEVLPVSKWRSSTMNALQNGDLESWAHAALTPEGYETWQEIDPTMEEIAEFFTSMNGQPGMPNRAARRAR
ncbi:hypothetical protein [Streptomyces coffeae]|uniref:Uncharacterized protein n=1 Tax=Streptomyces coffeae TaxID=621382 RepID=A0ABS1NG96_9ACTN|nr:hypothetical protein [Streptomyces coffeae]MBL1098920.1 hypothetical protein [Streptomyces coffeae]